MAKGHLRLPLLTLCLFAGLSSSSAQTPTDDCGSAPALPLGITAFDTTASTDDGPEECAQIGSDVWATFTAPSTASYRFSLCGVTNYDAAMAIYPAGGACPPLDGSSVGCDDDTCSSGGPPEIMLSLVAGETVVLQIGGWQAANGIGEIDIVEIPAASPEDFCSGAVAIGPGVTAYDTSFATDDGPPECAEIGSDHWYTFTAPTDGNWRITLCDNTTYDAAMAVYPDSAPCPPLPGSSIDCNDDACGGGGPPIVTLPLLAGETVRLQVGGWQSAGGTGEILIEELLPLPPGADILIGDLFQMNQFGREGAEIAASMASTTCNAGADPLNWFVNPDPRHPFITQATYRIFDGRIEQIGMSWAKHGFGAAQTDACNLGCTPFPDNTQLGSGCSDIYGATTNAIQSILGPRNEINPWTGDYDFSTSLLNAPTPSFDSIERRMILKDADLDAAQYPGAQYVAEIYVLAHDDQEHTNSIAWEPIGVTGAPGGIWSFDTAVAPETVGPAIEAWPGATIVELLDPTGQDGRVYFGTLVTDLWNGEWRYEYAIQNLDLAGGIGQLSIPLPAGVNVSDLFFSAPEQREFGFDDEGWSIQLFGGSVLWQTDSVATATPQNPIRWGALYNFGFTADQPPVASTGLLLVHDPVGAGSLNAPTLAPEAPPISDPMFIRGDSNQDGVVNIADPIFGLQCLFACFPSCFDAEDANDDGAWNISDPIYTLGYLYQGGPEPPEPFLVCGNDPTLDMLDCSSHAACP